jgi:hypothetical protein
MPDELLRPTIGAGVDMKVRPWRLKSQLYVAFFGTAIACTVIAVLNARRLGVDAAGRRRILLAGAIGLAASTAAFLLLDDLLCAEDPYAMVPNIAATAIAMLCSLSQQRVQRPMDRAVQLRGTEYRSLWWPGIPAAIGGGILHTLVLYLVDVAL